MVLTSFPDHLYPVKKRLWCLYVEIQYTLVQWENIVVYDGSS